LEVFRVSIQFLRKSKFYSLFSLYNLFHFCPISFHRLVMNEVGISFVRT